MRIGMMADLYKPHISGVTNHIDLTRWALETLYGQEVFVFTFGEPQPDDDERVIRSPGLPLRVASTGLYLNLRYTRRARQLLQTMDVVHVHHPLLSGQLALRYAKPWGLPIVFTNHTRYDLYMRAYLPLLPDALGDVALKAYLPRFCREIDLVIAPSRGVQEMLRRLGVDAPIAVVPNGVDLRRFERLPEPWPRAQLGLEADHVVLIYVGRVAPEKNLPFLLRAFRGVHEVYPQARLLIVGDGPERENLEERARLMGLEQAVRFTGLVPYDEVPRYLRLADVFVTASVTEVHPLSVIEAMAAGLPVVGVRSPGVGEVVQHEVTGLLVEQDVAAYASAVGRLISEPETRARFGQAARQAARQYDVRHTAGLLLEHYQRLHRERTAMSTSPWKRLQRWFQRHT
ncbi:MAG: glycosyltransferase family 4 protein [Chloroflexi bacterium]|nr:glycosyltransferase family 4 protein [Chloroflexota bacterium]